MNLQTAQPSAEHRWLQRMIGEWTVAGEYQFASDQPAAHSA
ncbi:MAG: DUF1579 family protein, partial [Planctomycetaceae bacterium]